MRKTIRQLGAKHIRALQNGRGYRSTSNGREKRGPESADGPPSKIAHSNLAAPYLAQAAGDFYIG